MKELQVGEHKRTIKEREVTYTCEWCSQERTEMRYPGPKPRYCSADCKKDAQNELAAKRMWHMRQRRGEAGPHRDPGRGRPPKRNTI